MLATDHTAGYRVVARSDGVCDADAGEMAVWGPTHDSMLAFSPDAESLNFHPLPSGGYCVSLTTWVDWDRNGMGQTVSTRCLIVPRKCSRTSATTPSPCFARRTASEAWQSDDLHDAKLGPLTIGGGAAAVNEPLLEQLAIYPGAENMAELVQAACEATCLAVSGDPSPTQLIAGLFSCLPPECRLEILLLDRSEVFAAAAVPHRGALGRSRRAAVGRPLSERRGAERLRQRIAVAGAVGRLGPADRANLGQRSHRLPLGAGVEAAIPTETRRFAGVGPSVARRVGRLGIDNGAGLEEPPRQSSPARNRQAHAAHHRFAARAQAVPKAARSPRLDEAGSQLARGARKLGLLDDLVYEAISGRADAMEQLREEWPKIAAQLGDALLGESLEQYLRYAMSDLGRMQRCRRRPRPRSRRSKPSTFSACFSTA